MGFFNALHVSMHLFDYHKQQRWPWVSKPALFSHCTQCTPHQISNEETNWDAKMSHFLLFLSWIFLVNIFAEVHTQCLYCKNWFGMKAKGRFIYTNNWFCKISKLISLLPNAKIWEISFGKLVLERFTTNCPSS